MNYISANSNPVTTNGTYDWVFGSDLPFSWYVVAAGQGFM
jgi:hypothetical protein